METTKKAQHTPGPWTANFTRLNNMPIDFHIAGKKEGSINPVCYGPKFNLSLNPTGEMEHAAQIEADAALIASAPELKEGVRWLAQTIHQAYHQDFNGTFDECPKNTCQHATQLLAKATGN